MKICVPKETHPGEHRAAMVPANIARLVKLGARVEIEAGLGQANGNDDGEYMAAGAAVARDGRALVGAADIVLRVRKPRLEEVQWMQSGAIHISFLDPFSEPDLVRSLAARGVSAISLELLPRITRAQKMDALTSQASLAGYVAVILAAAHLNRIFPMMMTAAGTIAPARVLVIGAGVAGLQAIATAKRLGSRVDAYDTRPAVEEQVRSLGARFLKVELGETGQTSGGYARPLSEEQLRTQRDAMKKFCGEADVVITAAQVFGRKAPVIVTSEILAAMKRGSVIVDTAMESGGNVEGAVFDQIICRDNVTIIGFANLAGRVPVHASQVYSANLTSLIEEFWDRQAGRFMVNLDDEIIKGCLVTHAGTVCNERLRKLFNP